MDARDLGVAGRPGFLDMRTLLMELGAHRLHDLDALHALGMSRRRQVLGKDV